MAHIQKVYKNDGTFKGYRAFVELNANPLSGKRNRKSKLFSKLKNAEKWMAEQITIAHEGSFINPSNITVGEYILKRWLNKHKKPQIAATTYDRYKGTIKTHIIPSLGHLKLQDLRPDHIEFYFSSKRENGRIDKPGGLSENTLKKHYVLLNEAMNRAVKLKLIKYNPVQAVESPKFKKKKASAMSEIHYKKLLEVLEDDRLMYTFVMTELMTGMRKSEILGLEWSDIDLEKGVIQVNKRLVRTSNGVIHEKGTKTESSKRKIKISPKLINLLKRHKKKQQEFRLFFGPMYDNSKSFVFCKPNGMHYHPRTYNRRFNIALKKAGLPSKYTIHTLRHTFATINLRNGIPAKIVQEMLGHSTISTTLDLYTHVDLEMQNEAVKKLENKFDF